MLHSVKIILPIGGMCQQDISKQLQKQTDFIFNIESLKIQLTILLQKKKKKIQTISKESKILKRLQKITNSNYKILNSKP